MTHRDYKLALLIGPILSVATLWAIHYAWGVGSFSRDPWPWLLASVPALTGLIWGISRRPSFGFGLMLVVGVGAITIGLAYATVVAWFLWKSTTDPGFLN